MRSKKIKLTSNDIIHKCNEILKSNGIPARKTYGWFSGFKSIFNVKHINFHGDFATVDQYTIEQ